MLTLIYNADGGFFGEVRYVLGKVLGHSSCSLCSITHTATGEKRAWQTCRGLLRDEVRALHRNELEPALARFVDERLPAVVAETGQGYLLVLGPAELDDCHGRVGIFQERLARKAAELGLVLFAEEQPGPG